MDSDKKKKEIRIPNLSTKAPVPFLDAALLADLAYFGFSAISATTPAGIAMVAVNSLFAIYVGSSMIDYVKKRKIKRINFMKTYGADVKHFKKMPKDIREKEISGLIEKVNDEYTNAKYERKDLAEVVDKHLTDYIANITDQRVITSTKLRNWGVSKMFMPTALGACDVLSGEVYIFQDRGIFEPHVIGHEFVHRKGYFKELDAQVLAYLSQIASKDPILVQSANCERLTRNMAVLKRDRNERRDFIENSKLRPEIKKHCIFGKRSYKPSEKRLTKFFEGMYDLRMKASGQNGITDYDEGFTSFLCTIGK